MTIIPATAHPTFARAPESTLRDWRHGGGEPARPRDVARASERTTFLPTSVVTHAGLVMLLIGLLVVAVGIYLAETVVDVEDRTPWLTGTGFGGLAIAVVGGSVYAGSWISRLVRDSHAVHRQIAETLLALADVTAQTTGASTDVGAIPVTVGDGTVVHRRDCPLVAYRPDLTPADSMRSSLSTCRVCKPERNPV